MKKHLTKRLLSLVIVLALCLGMMAVPGFAAEPNGLIVEKVDNSAVSAQLNNREQFVGSTAQTTQYDEHDMVRVSIVVDGKSTLDLAQDKGLSLSAYVDTPVLVSHRAKLLENQQTLAARISEKALAGAELDVVWNLTLAANIISANVEYGQIEAIKAVKGVKNVVLECQYEPAVAEKGGENPDMATSPVQTGSSAAWLSGYTGAGSRIAIIDTGTDTDHQSFDNGAFLYALAENAEKAGMSYDEYVASLDLLDAEEISAVFSELNVSMYSGLDPNWLYINEKLAYGFNYVDVSLTVNHDKDRQGEHGSHVAGIATSNRYIPTGDGYESALESVYVQGVAPDAQLITMKVFGAGGGAFDSDYMAAIEDAIVLKADAVNLSLGSASPGFTYSDTYEDIMDSLTESNLVAVMSAGNNYKWSEYSYYGTLASLPYLFADDVATHTGGSPGAFTNSLAVASVDNAGFTTLCIKVGDKAINYNEVLTDSQTQVPYGNKALTTIGGEHEFVFIDGIGINSDEDGNLFDNQFEAIKDIVEGKIALCYRGTSSFFEKANAAVAAGAIAVIIVNNQSGVINMALTGYEYSAPVVSILQTDGEYFKVGERQTTNGVNYWTGTMEVRSSIDVGMYDSEYYTMSDFSSWGVPGDLSLKPEITAPGGNIYSVFGSIPSIDGAPANTATDKYEIMSGTSMSAPQVTGMVALVMQHIRENDLSVDGLTDRALAMSLLMSTAVPMREGESGGNYYPVLRQGSGLANVGAAVTANSYILMGEDATVSAADGKIKAELGDDPAKTGSYEITFTINNLTGVEQGYTLSADFFTQDMFEYSGLMFLDTWTTPVDSTVTWLVNGEPMVMSVIGSGLDFDGDTDVDLDDGQALLDYLSGVRASISNPDKADIDADGDVDSYDAYLFYVNINGGSVLVPANGSVEITAQVQLDTAMLDQYPTGAFVEGYIYAQNLSTEEGVAGETHSIPVLGFYGNWTEPSMYDNYGYVYDGGYYNPTPISTNVLTMFYAGDPDEYLFGGNPMVADDTYMPERDALSAYSGNKLGSYYFTSIRNAGNGLFLVTDAETGEIYAAEELGKFNSAYFSVSKAAWQQFNLGLSIDWTGADVSSDTKVNVSLVLVPEYYAEADGSYDWANILPQLGEGAYLTTTMTMDHIAPELDESSVVIDTETNTLTFLAGDNQYVSAAALFDVYGQYLYTYTGSYAEANPGDVLEYVLDISEVDGPSFLLQVYDYAGNTTTYKITQQIGEVVDTVEKVTISQTSLTMIKGSTTTLTASVLPINAANRDFVWSTSNEAVATIDENGLVTAVGDGTAKITATSVADDTKSASCTVNVFTCDYTIVGALQDEVGSYSFEWNLAKDKTWTPIAELPMAIGSAAGTGTQYGFVMDGSTAISLVDIETGESLGTGSPSTVPYWDMSASYLTDGSGDTFVNAIYGSYLIVFDSVSAPQVMALNMGSYLAAYTRASYFVGVTTVGAGQDTKGVYDYIFALDNAGYIWTVKFYPATGNASLGYMKTGTKLALTANGDFTGTSMAMTDDGYSLFISHFDGNTNNIYMLDDNFAPLYVGNTGADVWPAAIFDIYANDGSSRALSVMEAAENADFVMVAEDVAVAPIELDPQPEGGLNAVTETTVSAPVVTRPTNNSIVVDGETLELDVVAKNENGYPMSGTNGLFTVTYDPASLTLNSIVVNADHYSVNVDEKTGTITVVYVAMDGIASDDAVANLTFTVIGDNDHPVVTFNQLNNREAYEYTETAHCFGEWYTLSQPEGPGTYGEERRECSICGHSETRRVYMPVTYPIPGESGSGSSGTTGGDLHICQLDKFSDLADDWYHDAVDYVVGNGIMNGTGDGTTFSPMMYMTRGMMMTMLARMAGVDTTTGSTWYEAGMNWAVASGISDGTAPTATMTREQLVTMLWRYVGSPTTIGNYLDGYADADSISSWAVEAMKWAVCNGIVQGNGQGLNPQGPATRIEVAQIIYNFRTR